MRPVSHRKSPGLARNLLRLARPERRRELNELTMENRIVRHIRLLPALALILFVFSHAHAQEKLLTIEDIYAPEPGRAVNFNGTSINPRWLKDGTSYLQTNPPNSGKPRILKVNALTGEEYR